MGVESVVLDMDAGAPSAQHMDMANIDAVIYAAGAGRVRGPLKQVLVDLSGAIRSVAAQESESVQRFVLLSGINTDVGARRSVDAAGADLDGPLASWHKLKTLRDLPRRARALRRTARVFDPLPGPPRRRRGRAGHRPRRREPDPRRGRPQGVALDRRVKTASGAWAATAWWSGCAAARQRRALAGRAARRPTRRASITLVDGVLPVQEAMAAV